jgi:putative ABC transport system permease protein
VPLRLVLANLRAHPVRSLLTLASLSVAIFLLCFLRSLLVALHAGVEASSSRRLIVQSAVSLFVDLPLAYQPKIEQVEGVETVCKFQWFGGVYQDPENFFGQFGVDEDRFFDTYPEVEILEGSREAFEAGGTACLIGRQLARRFGWKVGNRIPLQGTIFTRAEGEAWEFDVAGIYGSTSSNVDEMTMFFPFEYLQRSLEDGAATGPEGCGVFSLRIAAGVDPTAVQSKIDALFENGPQRVQTTTEAEFQRQFVSMMGNIPALLGGIGGGVLFAIVLGVLNTMVLAGRERTHHFGILKALGFSSGTAFGLLVVESVLLCAIGGAAGIALAVGSAPVVAAFLVMFPGFRVTLGTIFFGAGLSVGIGLLAGFFPARVAARLRPVEALRTEV